MTGSPDRLKPGSRKIQTGPDGKQQPGSLYLFRLLFRRHPLRTLGVLLISTAVIFASVGLLSTSSWLIAFCALTPLVAEILVPVVYVRLFGMLRGILRYAERLISHETTFRLLGDLRILLYRTFSRRPMIEILRLDYTDAFNRLVDDIERLQDFYLRTFNPFMTAVLSGLLGFGLLARTGSAEAVCFIIIYGLAIFAMPAMMYLITRGLSRRQAEQSSKARGLLLELLNGLAELKVSGALGRWSGNLAQQLDRIEETENRLGLSKSLATAWISQLSLLATVWVAWIGSRRVLGGVLNPLMLPVEIYMVLALFEAAQPIPAILQKLESSRQAAQRVLEMIKPEELDGLADLSARQKMAVSKAVTEKKQPETRPVITEPAVSNVQAISNIQIELRHVHYRYPEQTADLLSDFELTLAPGKRVAVVGASGSGKTTLTYLLLDWLQPTAGTIEVLPASASQASADRGELFSVVNQDVYFFNTTIINNLKMGNLQADDLAIQSALEHVGLAEVIANLPQGLETEIGEGETRLSGGQRQRLAIARALLRPAPFLILDEATAGIDLLTEQQLMRQLLAADSSARPKNQGILTISHRLVQMDAYDEILVLDQGRITERGAHRDLLNLGGYYARMWRLQKMIIDEQ